MPHRINVGGTWRDSSSWINVSGTWKRSSVWINVSGVWKKLLSAVMQAATRDAIDGTSPYNATAYFTLTSSTGAASVTGLGVGATASWQWLVGGLASDFEVRAVLVSGTAPSGSAMSTWLALSSTREWYIQQTTAGTTSSTFDVTIRDVSTAGSIVSVTGRITFSAQGG